MVTLLNRTFKYIISKNNEFKTFKGESTVLKIEVFINIG